MVDLDQYPAIRSKQDIHVHNDAFYWEEPAYISNLFLTCNLLVHSCDHCIYYSL